MNSFRNAATRARRVFALALISGLPLTTPILAQEDNMYVVMVEFDVTEDQTPEVLSAVTGLLDDLVRQQPGFVSARLQRQADGPMVVNNMVWESADSFKAFRAEHADYITGVVGPFEPKFRFFEVQKSVEPLE